MRNHLKLFTIMLSLAGLFSTAYADDAYPLKPIDTSSPRSTLKGFLAGTTETYTLAFSTILNYIKNGREMLSDEDLNAIKKALVVGRQTARALDFSKIPPAMRQETARTSFIELKEILDRIDIPPDEEIPDAKMMASSEFKRWTIPNTEITIARLETGDRIGEYVFTAETIERVPEFYERIKDHPYKTTTTKNWSEFRTRLPTGIALVLRNVIPPRIILGENIFTKELFLHQPLWRWIAIVIVILVCYLIILFFNWLSGTNKNNDAPATVTSIWRALLRPFGFMITSLFFSKVMIDVIHVSDSLYYFFNTAFWTIFYLSITWLSWTFGGAVAESIIISEKVHTTSIDGQVIRFLARLANIAGVIAIIITGGEQIGLPTYSVIASLGVGGLAFALAAQQTLANLLGSLIIMFEKPFLIGDYVVISSYAGTVEDVGFRSIRITTKTGSLVTIPSSQIVNGPVENHGNNPPPHPDLHTRDNPHPKPIEE